ncbi:MAG: DUF4339 domain-containing protein [Planctomycetes bacterium]|nr:DUF4339 domain-containing protein [Planctomycetota bacterium]
MSAEWFYQIMGETFGPVTAEQFKSLAADGTIDRDALIRKGEDGDWATADHVRGLFDPVTKETTPPQLPEQPASTSIAADLGFPTKRRFTAIRVGLALGIVSLLLLGIVIFSRHGNKVIRERATNLEETSETLAPADDAEPPTGPDNLTITWQKACGILRSDTSDIAESPDQELRRARDLLTDFITGLQAGEMPSERKTADELIRHIESVLSDSKVYGWLGTLDGATLINIQKEYSIAVPTANLEAFSPSFGLLPGVNSRDSFFRVIQVRGDGTQTDINLNSRQYATVLEAAFIDRILRQVGEAFDEVAQQELLRRKRRVAALDTHAEETKDSDIRKVMLVLYKKQVAKDRQAALDKIEAAKSALSSLVAKAVNERKADIESLEKVRTYDRDMKGYCMVYDSSTGKKLGFAMQSSRYKGRIKVQIGKDLSGLENVVAAIDANDLRKAMEAINDLPWHEEPCTLPDADDEGLYGEGSGSVASSTARQLVTTVAKWAEALKESGEVFRPDYRPSLNPFKMKTDDMGQIPPFMRLKVFQVIDDSTMIMSVEWGQQQMLVYVIGRSTDDITDGKSLNLTKEVFLVSGTRTYKTVGGSSKTVFEIIPALSEYLK